MGTTRRFGGLIWAQERRNSSLRLSVYPFPIVRLLGVTAHAPRMSTAQQPRGVLELTWRGRRLVPTEGSYRLGHMRRRPSRLTTARNVADLTCSRRRHLRTVLVRSIERLPVRRHGDVIDVAVAPIEFVRSRCRIDDVPVSKDALVRQSEIAVSVDVDDGLVEPNPLPDDWIRAALLRATGHDCKNENYDRKHYPHSHNGKYMPLPSAEQGSIRREPSCPLAEHVSALPFRTSGVSPDMSLQPTGTRPPLRPSGAAGSARGAGSEVTQIPSRVKTVFHGNYPPSAFRCHSHVQSRDLG